MNRFFIGLDCGGTRTRAALTDENLNILARAKAGPGNPLTAGFRTASQSYRRVINRLLSISNLSSGEIAAVGVGAAGAGREAERERIKRILKRILPTSEVRIASDGLIALLGATLGHEGIIVIAGTGSFVLGMSSSGATARGGGWGPLLGDEGSGASIGRLAIQAVLRAEDGRVAATVLRSRVLGFFKVTTIDELITRIYRRPPTPREYAMLWPIVLEVALEGDAAAKTLLRQGGEELAETVEAVAQRLRIKGTFPLTLAGGVLSVDSPLKRSLLGRLKKTLPRARLTPAASPPEIGAIHLARQIRRHRREL